MFRDRDYRIEKSENTEQKDSTNSSPSSLRRGFRRDLYGMSDTKGESGSHAQDVSKQLEHLVKEENPRIVHSQELQRIKSTFERDRYCRTEKSESNTEQQKATSSSCKEDVRRSLFGRLPSMEKKHPQVNLAQPQRILDSHQLKSKQEEQWKGSEKWNKVWDEGMEEKRCDHEEDILAVLSRYPFLLAELNKVYELKC